MREYQEKITEKLKNSKRENTAYEKVYLPNPRSLFDHRYRPDEQMVKKNVKWLEEIHYNPGQANFMRQGRLKIFQTLLGNVPHTRKKFYLALISAYNKNLSEYND